MDEELGALAVWMRSRSDKIAVQECHVWGRTQLVAATAEPLDVARSLAMAINHHRVQLLWCEHFPEGPAVIAGKWVRVRFLTERESVAASAGRFIPSYAPIDTPPPAKQENWPTACEIESALNGGVTPLCVREVGGDGNRPWLIGPRRIVVSVPRSITTRCLTISGAPDFSMMDTWTEEAP